MRINTWHSMHLVCDFDSTLFDTNKIWFAWLEILVQHGADRDFATQQKDILNLTGFTHRAHALSVGIPESEVDILVQHFLQHARNIGPELVYSDVPSFFDKYQSQHTFSVLTYGNAEYQESKILSTGLQKYFEIIRIADLTKNKVEHLKEILLSKTEIAFVDDSPKELLPVIDAGLPVKLYRIVRPAGMNDYVHEKDDVFWKRITSIDEIEF